MSLHFNVVFTHYNDIFSENGSRVYLKKNRFRKSSRNKYLFAYFSIRIPKKIFNVVFTHHIDIFSKDGRRDYPYRVTLSEIRLKQVLIYLFSDI